MPSEKRKASEAFRPVSNDSSKEQSHPSSQLLGRAQHLLEKRKQLPIWPHADEIRQKTRENDVVLLVGETGSGKSTQIPQFLFMETWCQPRQTKTCGIGGKIAIIQPRRVAAISLASRVAAEVGTPLGSSSPASQVGYAVRFDTNVGPSTRIKFLTDGMLLQELLRDPWLKEYSCIIVDEVHERGVNVDLVLGFMKCILSARLGLSTQPDGRAGVPLKVVVMSATADMQGIEAFFNDTKDFGSKDTTGTRIEDRDSSAGDRSDHGNGPHHSKPKSAKVTSCHIKGRQYPVTLSYMSMATTNILDTAMEKIIDIHQHTPLPGDILVFLSGQEMIENLESLCHTYAATLIEKPDFTKPSAKKEHKQKLPALQILPLFASLPTHLQSRIFQPTPRFTRRIILSTNIAETSLTVPGIRHVIDSGKHKARLFRPGLNLDTLLSTPISQSMARQRSGRAGREAPGTCYRLYTEKDFGSLEKDTKPEILSTDLNFLVLTLKAHGVDNILDFPLLTRPPRKSLEASLEGLLNLEGLDTDTGKITDVGRKMAMLPVRADLARVLLEGTKFSEDILDGVIDVVAALSLEEGVFLPIHAGRNRLSSTAKKSSKELLLNHRPNGQNHVNGHTKVEDANFSDDDSEDSNPIESARREILSRHSDHLTLLNAIGKYGSPDNHDRRAWCDAHGISHRAMSRIMDVRKQLRQMMNKSKHRLVVKSKVEPPSNGEAGSVLGDLIKRDSILKCLVAGLWQNVALQSSLGPVQAVQAKQNPNQKAPYVTLLTKQPIHIHPSSVLFTHRGGSGVSKSTKSEDGEDSKDKRVSTNSLPPAVLFTDLIYTSKPYARNVSAIDLSWLADIGKIA